MGLFLLIIALIGFGIVLIPALVMTLFTCRDWMNYFMNTVRAFDQFCCVFFQYPLNLTMLKKNAVIRFGNIGEYMSDVFAKNYFTRYSDLTKFGLFWCIFLKKEKDPSFKN